MKRRTLIKTLGLSSLGISALARASARTSGPVSKPPFITVAHITDVHIDQGNNAPERFSRCLKTIVEKHKPAFFLNGGDSIMDASYADVKRERVTSQWQIWDECIKSSIPGHEIHSCIGNHDTWWSAPSQEDAMYGKPYVVQRLNIPGRYYSFDKGSWHFIEEPLL